MKMLTHLHKCCDTLLLAHGSKGKKLKIVSMQHVWYRLDASGMRSDASDVTPDVSEGSVWCELSLQDFLCFSLV